MSKPRAALAHAADGDAGSRSRSASRSVFRRIAAAFTALAFGAGLALVAVAAPASAHHNTITGTAVCDPATETFDIKWTVENSENRNEVITGSSNPSLVPEGTKFDKKEKKTFTQHSVDAGSYSLTLDAKWDNGSTQRSTTTVVVGGAGDECGEGDTKKVTLCHATSSGKNPYVRITVSVNAFYKQGHLGHDDDIYPAFSFTKRGEVINVPAHGDQSLLQYEDCVKPIVKITLPTPNAVDSCGVADDHIEQPAAIEGVEWTISSVVDGKATATATALDGYVFANDKTEKVWKFDFTDEPCPLPAPVAPTAVDQCGVDADGLVLPELANVSWKVDGEIKEGSTVTVTAIAAEGFEFPKDAKTVWKFDFTNVPCPPQTIPLNGTPTMVDLCGVDGDVINLPATTSLITWTISGDPKSGAAKAVATAAEGYTFEDGITKEFPFTFDTTPCPTVIPVPAVPVAVDLCGVDDDEITLPTSTDQVTWSQSGDPKQGTATAIATAKSGFVFEGGETEATFEFEFDDTACVEPSLDGSILAGQCEANAPWIAFDVVLNDPDKQSTGNTAFLVLSDGEHTERIELGELEGGMLSDRVLWPGAAVDADGTPTAWPGWMQIDGRWVLTDDNFGWTRDVTSATLEVNPTLAVDLVYPPATPDCEGPTVDIGGGGAAGSGNGLAETGFAGTTIGIVAGVVVAAGIAFLVIARVRRKRS